MTQPSIFTRLLPLTLGAVLASSGCFVFVEDNGDPEPAPARGDVTFLWAFDGEPRCDNAGIKEVRVAITDGATTLYDAVETCEGGGLTIRDIDAGTHDIELEAFNFTGEPRYRSTFTIDVLANVTNDYGELNLAPVGGAPGEVEFLWSFLYPANAPETDCATAGVIDVDVEIFPAGSAEPVYGETFACSDDGARVSNLPAGDYELRLRAYGTFNDADLLLYDSGDVAFTVTADALTALGDVELPRDDANFADVDVNWALSDTCEALGVTDIAFNITRVGAAEPDDTFTAACDADTTELRTTFVPGDYVVEATATGESATYFGAATINTAPGETTEVDLNLVAQ